MCGILGVTLKYKDQESIEFIKSLIRELKIRGLHSFGLVYQDTEFHRKILNNLNVDHLLEDFLKSESMSFIYHNRYSTSGDYINSNNNQPIVVPGVGAIAMNGVISQATKEEYEKLYDVKCESENDTEILLRKMEQGISIPDFVKKNENCSFAAVYIKNKDDIIYGYRNNKRPLYEGTYKNVRYIVSTLDTIKRSDGDLDKVLIVPKFTEISL